MNGLVEALNGKVCGLSSCLLEEAYVAWSLLTICVVLTIVAVVLRERRHTGALALQITYDSSGLFDWRMLILLCVELKVV